METDYREYVLRVFKKYQNELSGMCGKNVEIKAEYRPYPSPWNRYTIVGAEAVWNAMRTYQYEDHIAAWDMSPLPGNDCVAVVHGSWVVHYMHGRGIGTLLNKIRIEAFGEVEGASALMATVNDSNAAEHGVLGKCGWTEGPSVDKWCHMWVRRVGDD